MINPSVRYRPWRYCKQKGWERRQCPVVNSAMGGRSEQDILKPQERQKQKDLFRMRNNREPPTWRYTGPVSETCCVVDWIREQEQEAYGTG